MWWIFLREPTMDTTKETPTTPRSLSYQRDRDYRRKARLWAIIKSWRYGILCKKEKHDPYRFTDNERDVKHMYEESLFLHDILRSSCPGDQRLDFVRFIYQQAIQQDTEYAMKACFDRQNRTMLHHAVLNNWDIDDIAWAVDLYPDAVSIKDCDVEFSYVVILNNYQGFSPLTSPCTSSSKKSQGLFEDENYEGCKRLYTKTTQEYLSCVPHFDHTVVEDASSLDAKSASEQIEVMWTYFISVWGHFDPPLVVVDLPSKLRVTLGAQWFYNDMKVENCTSDTMDVTSSAIPEDAGHYVCELTNWKGTVRSTTVSLIVLDDSIVIDPSTRYYRSTPLEDHETLFNVNASIGGVLDVHGIQIFVHPFSFDVYDLFDTNLATTSGIDIVVGIVRYPKQASLPLHNSRFVSSLVYLSPTDVDPFYPPWTCRIPHSSTDIASVAVLQLVPIDSEGTLDFQVVPTERVSDTFVDIDLIRLGTFVVVQSGSNVESTLACRERMSLYVYALNSISVGVDQVVLEMWLSPTRSDCCHYTVNKNLIGTLPVALQHDTSSLKILIQDTTHCMSVATGQSSFLGNIRCNLGQTQTNCGFGFACLELDICVGETKHSHNIILPLMFGEAQTVLGCELVNHDSNCIQLAWKSNASPNLVPAYYVVEMATFSKTFWDRYNAVWWFDRGNLSVVNRMYKVAHMGMDTQVAISTKVHAASIRIASCNLDTFGDYSDNILITLDTLAEAINRDEKRLQIPFEDISMLLYDNQLALEEMISQVYTSTSFYAIYGMTTSSLASIVSYLESKRKIHRAMNYGVVLLLLGLEILVQKTSNAVLFHRELCLEFVSPFALASRLTPALDFNFQQAKVVVNDMHIALQEMFDLVRKCFSPGWFCRFLVADAAKLHESFSTVLETLVTKCQKHPLFASEAGRGLLSYWENRRHVVDAVKRTDKDNLRQLHAWSVLGHPNYDRIAALQYFSSTFQFDMMDELKSDAISEVCAKLQEENTLKKRLIHVSPVPNEMVPYTSSISVRFDGSVISVDCLRFFTIKNTLQKVRVNGDVTFDAVTRCATFTPTVALESRSTFKVKLRAEAVSSIYGPLRATMKYSFTTKPK
ncbi:hypothetical protein AeRB84_001343 [Aphanomyces euteiches]|nr:hypothetical protein AeRB84_001343 [Aphanomyces euteiches]